MKVIQTADGSPTLFSERYNESFHSTFGAATESRHVFLDTAGVTQRLASGKPTRILEIGFGLGLNALLSCDAAISANTHLTYHAVEHDYGICELSQRIDFAALLDKPELASVLQDALSRVHLDSVNVSNEDKSGKPASTSIDFSPNTTLQVHWTDALTLDLSKAEQFDAIYLDAFSPDNNPECWTVEFFTQLKLWMAADAKLSTYCAKGSVRRALIASGFSVQKLPGPPGKREIMLATLKNWEAD